MIYIRGCKTTRATSIVLRGPNDYMLDEVDRSLHDALMVVKRCLESKSLVVGGGCVEAALSVFLEHFATTLGTREQLAIQQFAEALLVIPKTLASNAACDVTELIARLCAKHAQWQTQVRTCTRAAGESASRATSRAGRAARARSPALQSGGAEDARHAGLDLIAGKVVNNLDRGVVEPAISKIKSLRFATEAAVTIMRIDDMIRLNEKEEHGDHPHP